MRKPGNAFLWESTMYMLEFAENFIVGSFSFYFTLSIGKFVHSKNQQLAHSEFFNMEF